MQDSQVPDLPGGLTVKQRKWLDVYLKTGNATEAAMQAYDCNNRVTAAAIGSENLRKLPMDELLEAGGISDKKLLGKIDEGLEATKVVSAKILVLGGDKDANAQTDDFIDVPDYPTRHKYLETALKLKKRLGSESSSVEMKDGERSITFKVSRGE
jgi:hypothetical protein